MSESLNSTIDATRLAPASRLGPYEILSPLGSGGMAEVYRARDTRLNRTVAIKVLRSHLPENDELRQRFFREARAISSLNHPNVCALYDVGHSDGIDFLVMEYLEGESLAERLTKGRLPLHQVLRYGIEISDALDRAHRQGIIHRDLKPGNIILTRSGVKLLDFGLAKMTPATADSSESNPVTREGVVFGTPLYMAPEQLESAEIDARADIFSLGIVLYEMAAGERPFAREKRGVAAEVLLTDPGSIARIPVLSLPALDQIVRMCLARDPEDRWQTARDVTLQLKAIAEGITLTSTAVTPTAAAGRHIPTGRLLAAAFLVALASVAGGYLIHKPRDMPVLKLSILPPEKAALDLSGTIAVSPSGKIAAIAGKVEDGSDSIWIRPVDSLDAVPLSGTREGKQPFWSPNGNSLGFFAAGKLQRIGIAGGPPRQLAEASEPFGGSWNQNGVILFSPTAASGIYRVSSEGGTASPVTTLDAERQETSHRWPYFLPDGRHFLYTVHSRQRENNGIFVGSIDTVGPGRLILSENSRVEYALPGYLLFVRGQNLMAQPFDARTCATTGEAFPVAANVGYNAFTGNALFSASENKTLLYAGVDSANTQLFWVDRHGKRLGAIGPAADYHEPSFSPEQSKVVVTRVDQEAANNDLWIVDLASGSFSRFTFNPSNEFTSLWSPDGSRIVFSSNRGSSFGLYQKLSNGTGQDSSLLNAKDRISPDDFSPDGRYLLYEDVNPKTQTDLWFLPLFGTRRTIPFLQSNFNETHAQFSPDGKWIAYTSDETGRAEVYMQNSPLTGNGSARAGKWQISTDGGDQVWWRRDNKELYYLSPGRKVMSVEIQTEPNVRIGAPVPLFDAHVAYNPLTGDRNQYLVTADGQRFLLVASLGEDKARSITSVFNWPASAGRP